MAVALVDQADRLLLSAIFPSIKEEFHLSDSRLGALSSAFIVVATLGALPFGVLVDRRKRTAIVAWGAAIWSTAMVFTGAASSYLTLFLSRMFLGAAESSYTPAGFSLLSDYYPVEERGRVMGQFRAATILAFASLPLGGVITDTWGWRTAFHVYAIPGFVIAVVAWRLNEPPRGARDIEHQGLDHAEAGTGSEYARMRTGRAIRAVLQVPTVRVILVGDLVSTFFTAGLTIWWTIFLVRYHDMSLTQATSWTAVFGLFGVTGVLVGGYLGDRLVGGGLAAGRLYVAAGAKVLCTPIMAAAIATDSTVLFIALMLPGAMCLTAPFAPLSALRADVVHPDMRGRLASVTAVLFAIGGAASPLLFGSLSDRLTLRTAELIVLPLLAVGGIYIWMAGPKHVERDLDRMRRQLAGDEMPLGARPGG